MSIRVDSWTTGVRGDMVQLPLAQCMHSYTQIEQRVVHCADSPKSDAFGAIPVPRLATPGTRRMAALPKMMMDVPSTRAALSNWYTDGPRVVHVAMWSPWDHLYLDIPKRHGAKILLTVHDAQKHIGEESWILSKLEDRIIGMADHIAVLSDYAKETLRARLPSLSNVTVMAPGLIMDTSTPRPAKPVPSGRPMRFLFFGRIHAYKGLDILLDAWQLIKSSDAPPMELSIVGSGDISPYRSAIEKSRDVTVTHGWITDDDMARTFAYNDVNVMAYRETSASATALAGLWAGMPTVVTAIPGLKDYFVNGENALVTNDLTPEAVATEILKLAQSPELYDRLARGANRHAQHHSAQTVVGKWSDLYHDIWSRQRW